MHGCGSDLRDGVLQDAFKQLLGRDMPPVMEFSGEAGPLHHRPGMFDIISLMLKLGSLEPLAKPELQEGYPPPDKVQGPTPWERHVSPMPAAVCTVEPELAVPRSIVNPRGKGKALTPPLSSDSCDNDRRRGVK